MFIWHTRVGNWCFQTSLLGILQILLEFRRKLEKELDFAFVSLNIGRWQRYVQEQSHKTRTEGAQVNMAGRREGIFF